MDGGLRRKDVERTQAGYSPPKANREEVEKLKELYRKKYPEEFSPRKTLRKGFPHPDKNAHA
jgi:hypothetical protein